MDGNSLILAIETATGCGSVALTRGDIHHGRLLAECTCQPEVSHSRRLLGSVQWLMEAAGVNWNDLTAVGVSLGPGSFTGLRIGLAAAKGIAMAMGLPLIGVPTLDAMATGYCGTERLICCVLDARKQEVYAGLYRIASAGYPEKIGDYLVTPPKKLIGTINQPAVLAGPGVSLCLPYLSMGADILPLPETFCLPSAARVGFLAGSLLQQGILLDPVTAAPLYVRASEAEINLKRTVNSDNPVAG